MHGTRGSDRAGWPVRWPRPYRWRHSILLGTRFVQGFIFWGGASRRLIYDFHEVAGVDHAVKLDFDLPGYVAAKLTHALPGALWVQSPIEWTLAITT